MHSNGGVWVNAKVLDFISWNLVEYFRLLLGRSKKYWGKESVRMPSRHPHRTWNMHSRLVRTCVRAFIFICFIAAAYGRRCAKVLPKLDPEYRTTWESLVLYKQLHLEQRVTCVIGRSFWRPLYIRRSYIVIQNANSELMMWQSLKMHLVLVLWDPMYVQVCVKWTSWYLLRQ